MATRSGAGEVQDLDYGFDDLLNGNLTFKSDIGTLSYDDPLHPHAVTGAGADSVLHATCTKTITCPAGQVEAFEPGDTVEFDPDECGACPLRTKCTQAASGRGRTVSIAEDEALQSKFRKLQQTGPGRAVLRQRIPVEHALAHIAARKGHSARYIGARRNLFDLRRAAAIQNLESAQRLMQEAA